MKYKINLALKNKKERPGVLLAASERLGRRPRERGRGLRLILPPADELERQLVDAKIVGFYREQTLVPGRKFQADFCWPNSASMLVVEVDGGTFSRQDGKQCPICGETPKGRHATGTGRERDCEKIALTMLQGWRVMVVTTKQVRKGTALMWIRQALLFGSPEAH